MTTVNKFFATVILVGIWLLVASEIAYTYDGLFIRVRTVIMAEAQIFITLLFAMTGLRASLPGVPPIGMGIDFFGFIWVRSLLLGVSC